MKINGMLISLCLSLIIVVKLFVMFQVTTACWKDDNEGTETGGRVQIRQLKTHHKLVSSDTSTLDTAQTI